MTPLRQRLRHLRHGHLHRDRPDRRQELRADAGRRPHLESLQLVEIRDALVREMQQRAVVQMHREQLHALELVEGVLLDVVPQRRAAALGVPGHERQLEYLRLDEASGLVGRYRPDDIRHAVARLVEELRRRAAQLHRRVDLALDPAARLLADLLAPRVEHLRLNGGLRRQEVMQLQHDLLRARGARTQRDGDGGREQQRFGSLHGFSSSGGLAHVLNVWTRYSETMGK